MEGRRQFGFFSRPGRQVDMLSSNDAHSAAPVLEATRLDPCAVFFVDNGRMAGEWRSCAWGAAAKSRGRTFLKFSLCFSHVAGKYCKCSRAQRVGKCNRGLTSLKFAAWTRSTWQGSGFDGGAGTAEVALGA